MSDRHVDTSYGGSPPENYQRYFVPAIGAPLAEDLMAMAEPSPGERVLDVACGTGVVARLAAEAVGAGGSVTGVDIEPGMLAAARAATPPDPAIDWVEGSAEALPFPDRAFDVVLCQMGLQFVPGRSAALEEMHRVLDQGGRMLLNLPGPTPPLFADMGEALARHLRPEAAGFVERVFSLHDTGEVRELVAGAGFRDVSVRAATRPLRLPPPEDFLWQYVHSTPLAGAVGQMDAETRAAFQGEVAARWQRYMDGDELVLPVRMVVATARR